MEWHLASNSGSRLLAFTQQDGTLAWSWFVLLPFLPSTFIKVWSSIPLPASPAIYLQFFLLWIQSLITKTCTYQITSSNHQSRNTIKMSNPQIIYKHHKHKKKLKHLTLTNPWNFILFHSNYRTNNNIITKFTQNLTKITSKYTTKSTWKKKYKCGENTRITEKDTVCNFFLTTNTNYMHITHSYTHKAPTFMNKAASLIFKKYKIA